MYRFFILLFAVSFIVPSTAEAVIECHAKTPPRINVQPVKSRIKYDFTKSKADLNSIDVDTISPYGPQHKTNVSGLMSGAIQLKSNVSFIHETYKFLGRGCVFLKGVDVKIHLDPTIFIAREFPRGTCMHQAILGHEFEHVEIDRVIINKYTNLIGKAVERVIAQEGSTYGPMKERRMVEIQEQVKNSIHKAVLRMNDDLNEERARRQQALDSLEEYESIGNRCKEYKGHSRRRPARR